MDPSPLVALHDLMMDEARSVGLDHVLELHESISGNRSITELTSPSPSDQSSARYTPSFWRTWTKDVKTLSRASKYRQLQPLKPKQARYDIPVPSSAQQTFKAVTTKYPPKFAYPPTTSLMSGSGYDDNALTLRVSHSTQYPRVKGAVDMATYTSRNTLVARDSHTSSGSIPSLEVNRSVRCGSFQKAPRFKPAPLSTPNTPPFGFATETCDSTGDDSARLVRTGADSCTFGTSRRSTSPNSLPELSAPPGPGAYVVPRLFDGENPREERFKAILLELLELEKRNNMWCVVDIQRLL
jgi:hypothetical protein